MWKAVHRSTAILCLSIAVRPAWGESTSEHAVQASAVVQGGKSSVLLGSSAQITLNWPQDTFAIPKSYTISRKSPGATSWGTVAVLPGTTTSFTDNNVLDGSPYEYEIFKTNSTYAYSGFGYIWAGANLPLVENRGQLVLIVDNTYAADLAPELGRLMQDLVGDGWTVLRHDVARNDSVARVKNLIQMDYYADPSNVKAVFLFGHLPVPYSGDIVPDEHDPDHRGAWSADVYYGDVDGAWTDYSVNDTAAASPRNWNVPGDGKFDQSFPPSAVELQVGRVDLSGLTAFSLSEKELLRQYLNKDHNYRHKLVTAERRGLIHDSFGVRGGSAYAASGWRNFAPWFGPDRITVVPMGQWFQTLAAQSYQWAYGCGAGSYYSIAGLGNADQWNSVTTWDFAGTDARAFFFMFVGSWLIDWDHENDIMRAALALRNYGLACVVAGLPHWFGHHLALGETIGFSTRLTQNNGPNGLYRNQINDAAGEVHVALLGDPTLRLHPVAPPSALTGTMDSSGVRLNWSAAPDSILGYHVYRAASASGPFTRLTSTVYGGTSFADGGVNAGTYTYMVRAVKLETTPSGSYYNSSQGIFTTLSQSQPSSGVSVVTVQATDANAAETGPDPGVFTFTRSGSTASELTVSYFLSGSATKWTDYRRAQGDMPVTITIPAGASTATLTIYPTEDAETEGTETVTLSLEDDANYLIGSPDSATVSIADNNNSGPAPAPARDYVWVDDALPAGAWGTGNGGDSWQWASSNPEPYSGTLAHQSALFSGTHYHYFSGASSSASMPVNSGDTLFAYVFLDPANPPQEVMLQWFDGASWGHAAYWGANWIPWGTDGTPSQQPMGALPPTGRWTRLEVPARLVGLESSRVSGINFILHGGRATWDFTGKASP